eukprot:scaffold4495_cov63-Phaeocystis_antarctica.AAC.2
MISGSPNRLISLLLEREPSKTARSTAAVTIKLRSSRVATGCSEMHDAPLDSRIMWSPPLSKQPRKSAAGTPTVFSAIRGIERSLGMSSPLHRKDSPSTKSRSRVGSRATKAALSSVASSASTCSVAARRCGAMSARSPWHEHAAARLALSVIWCSMVESSSTLSRASVLSTSSGTHSDGAGSSAANGSSGGEHGGGTWQWPGKRRLRRLLRVSFTRLTPPHAARPGLAHRSRVRVPSHRAALSAPSSLPHGSKMGWVYREGHGYWVA